MVCQFSYTDFSKYLHLFGKGEFFPIFSIINWYEKKPEKFLANRIIDLESTVTTIARYCCRHRAAALILVEHPQKLI